jgi:hypothetical protein
MGKNLTPGYLRSESRNTIWELCLKYTIIIHTVELKHVRNWYVNTQRINADLGYYDTMLLHTTALLVHRS